MFDIARIASSLSTWWWLVLCLMFLLYVGLDGADLGAGIFALFSPDEEERGAIMASMAGFWDGCHGSAIWSQIVVGIMAPLPDRQYGAKS